MSLQSLQNSQCADLHLGRHNYQALKVFAAIETQHKQHVQKKNNAMHVHHDYGQQSRRGRNNSDATFNVNVMKKEVDPVAQM
eukprot:Pgem_evm1s13823